MKLALLFERALDEIGYITPRDLQKHKDYDFPHGCAVGIPVRVGRYLYHVTNVVNRQSINLNGLQPNQPHYLDPEKEIKKPAVWATTTNRVGARFEPYVNSTDTWQIDNSIAKATWYEDCNYDRKPEDDNGTSPVFAVVTFQDIPREALRLYKKGKTYKRWSDDAW